MLMSVVNACSLGRNVQVSIARRTSPVPAGQYLIDALSVSISQAGLYAGMPPEETGDTGDILWAGFHAKSGLHSMWDSGFLWKTGMTGGGAV
ncbi:hypothetical protein BSKO_10044 [Bryopsis sp. KO-2023]|nr:hypothetical protein BSKO_10044 [Bryopsis sp. KO-2023]